MRQARITITVLLVLYLMIGCATFGMKPYTDMTPKEKMAFIYTSYNKQYEDYKVQAARPNLTDVDKNVLRGKKDMLTKVYPIIQMADMGLVEGKPWDAGVEKTIISYLRQLGTQIK
jgi:hypothetical protein